MKKISYKQIIFIALSAIPIFYGCKKDSPVVVEEPVVVDPGKTEAPATTQKVNNFIKDAMGDVYLW